METSGFKLSWRIFAFAYYSVEGLKEVLIHQNKGMFNENGDGLMGQCEIQFFPSKHRSVAKRPTRKNADTALYRQFLF